MVSVMIVNFIKTMKMMETKIRMIRVKMVYFSFKSTTVTCNRLTLTNKGNNDLNRALTIVILIDRF